MNGYIGCMRSQTHILNREDGKFYLEITFVSSMLKILAVRDDANVPNDDFLIEMTRTFLKHDMVTHCYLLVLPNPYLHYLLCSFCGNNSFVFALYIPSNQCKQRTLVPRVD